ncbi:arylamine N-acetyltransferase [Anaerovorax odorimutans]|uniref:Arylamine N-acetyltransferase n=1 Tax=Anaerovorax odorimutans TaxID=109327 RepID=A0ABT1RP02_9FIRM|nr:arylamine N-acetyltransferase [Anaerovorax odorimutans]MCQ4636921.1 arylamine N-acetyltransferase [Anaerovorax odorimutans]
MYEGLYRKLPSTKAYLDRIGMDAPQEPDEAYLDRLILAHQYQVPFENIDTSDKHLTVSLDTEVIFDKIVIRKRGGCCFELNALFLKLLTALGFDAWACRCRVLRGKDFFPPSSHRAALVRLNDGIYFCDVGYGGPQPACAVKVEDGSQKSSAGQTFRIRREDDYWWTLLYMSKSGPEETMQFTMMPEDEVDFVPLSHFCFTHPDSFFSSGERVISRRIPGGSVSIEDNLFTRVLDGVREEAVITDEEQYRKLLIQEFGIKL